MSLQKISHEQFEALGVINSIRKLEQDSVDFLITIKSLLISLIHNKTKIEQFSSELDYPEEFTATLSLLSDVQNGDCLINNVQLSQVLGINSINCIFKLRDLINEHPEIFGSFDYSADDLLAFIEKFVILISSEKPVKKLTTLHELAAIIKDDFNKYSILFPLQYASSSLVQGDEIFSCNVGECVTYLLNALFKALFGELDRIARDDLKFKNLELAKNEILISSYLAKLQSIIDLPICNGEITVNFELFIKETVAKFEDSRDFAKEIDVFVKSFGNQNVTLKQRLNQSLGKSSFFSKGICYGHSRESLIANNNEIKPYKYMGNKKTYNDLNSIRTSASIIKHQMNQQTPNQSLLDSNNMAIIVATKSKDLNSTLLDIQKYYLTSDVEQLEVQLIWRYTAGSGEYAGHAVAITMPRDVTKPLKFTDSNIGVCTLNGTLMLVDFINKLISNFYKPIGPCQFEAIILRKKPVETLTFNNIIKSRETIRRLCVMYSSGEFETSNLEFLATNLELCKSIKQQDLKVSSIKAFLLIRMIELTAPTNAKQARTYLLRLNNLAPDSQTFYFYWLYVAIFAHCQNDLQTAKYVIDKLIAKKSKLADLYKLSQFCDTLFARIGQYLAAQNCSAIQQSTINFFLSSKSWQGLLSFVDCLSPEGVLVNYSTEAIAEILAPYQWLPMFVENFYRYSESFSFDNVSDESQAACKKLLSLMLEQSKYFRTFMPFEMLSELRAIKRNFPQEQSLPKAKCSPQF